MEQTMSLVNMKSAKLSLVAAATALLLSACASTPEECDPSQDQGFFGKMGCIVTGSYSERIDRKQAHLDELKAEAERLNALAREIHAKDRDLMGGYLDRARTLDKTRSELNAIQANLAKKKALSADLEDKLAAAKKQVAAMNNESAANESIKKKKAEIAKLNATIEELQAAMDESAM